MSGDMADFTNEHIEIDVEHAEKYRDAPLNVQYDEGLIDETGAPINSYTKKKPSGPGPCPICGATTMPTEGKFGRFYGCREFPKCKGSRNSE